MASQNRTLTLRPSEVTHLLVLLGHMRAEGIYYGSRAQYWRRHERLIDKLNALAPKATREAGETKG